jgi:hypothetical protein
VTPDSVPARGLEVRVRKVAGQLVVAGPDGSSSIELSDTAALVWRAIDGRRTVREVGALLATEYDVDAAEAVQDVLDMVTELTGLGLLSVPA